MNKKSYKLLVFSFFIFIACENTVINNKSIEISELSEVWRDISLLYVDSEIKQAEIDSLYSIYLEKILKNQSDDYRHIIRLFVYQIHDGHTNYFFSDDVDRKRYYAPLRVEYINGKYVVSAYDKELKDRIALGDVVTKINKFDIEDYVLKKVYPTNFCTKYSYKYTLAKNIFSGKEGTIFEVELQDVKGRRKTIRSKALKVSPIFYKQIHSNSYSFSKRITFKKFGKTAYIHLPTFRTNIVYQFEKIIDSLKTAENIIFDLRGNTGGSSVDGKISQYFSNEDSISLYTLKYKLINCQSIAHGSLNDPKVKSFLKLSKEYSNNFYKDYINNRIISYTLKIKNVIKPKGLLSSKRVVILTDYRTASAAESFILEFKAIGKGFCIGQPTFGSCSMPAFYPLPSGDILSVSTVMTTYNDGSMFRGVIPDIVIDPTVDNYLSNNDTILQAALKFINLKQK